MAQTVVVPTTDGAPVVTIGANFSGSNVFASGLIPPDSEGAVGPGQFVELINGVYRVYDKTGTTLQQSSLDDFWRSAGIADVNFAYDPQVLYDPASQRWFATSSETPEHPHPLLVAVSNTSDPTQGWKAISIPFDFGGQYWADFPKLGINQDGLFISALLVPFVDGFHAGRIVIPKSDLLQAVPTGANATVFLDPAKPEIYQVPAVAFQSTGSEPFLAGDRTPDGQLTITSVDGPVTNPSLNLNDRVVPVAPMLGPDSATQKGTDIQVATGPVNFNFGSSVVLQDGKLFAVQGVGEPGLAELRWLEIGDPLTNPVVLDSGIISPPGLDVYYGSIAVNPLGEVVIGFSGSGPNDDPSAYAVAGTLNGDKLTFGSPILLRAGEAPDTTGRFGDYSATTYDPTNPSHFWTIQEWSSALGWFTEISEIVFAPPPPTVQTWFGGTGNFSDPQNWVPAGSPAATDTLVIDAGRTRADNLTITNPNILLGSPTTTPTLVLQDSILAGTSSVRVQTTTFDPAQPDLEARIRVVGAVTEDGTVDVGTIGSDLSQFFPAHLTVSMAKDSSFTMDPGAIWLSRDGSTIDVNGPERTAQFINNGEVEAFGGTVRMNVSVAGQGTFDVLSDNSNIRAGTLEFTEDVGAGETIKLTAGLLKLDEPKNFLASIRDFNPDSTIELTHAKVTSADYSNGVLTLFDERRVEARLNIVGDFTTEQFAIANHDGNAFITLGPSAPVSAEQSVSGADGLTLDKQVTQFVSAMATHSAGNSDAMTTAIQTQNDSNVQNMLAPAGHM